MGGRAANAEPITLEGISIAGCRSDATGGAAEGAAGAGSRPPERDGVLGSEIGEMEVGERWGVPERDAGVVRVSGGG